MRWSALVLVLMSGVARSTPLDPTVACDSLASAGIKTKGWAQVYGGSGFACTGQTDDPTTHPPATAFELGLVIEGPSPVSVTTVEIDADALDPAAHDATEKAFLAAVDQFFAKSGLAAPGKSLGEAVAHRKSTTLKLPWGSASFAYTKPKKSPKQAEVFILHLDVNP